MQYEELATITLIEYDEIVAIGSDTDRESAVLRLGLFCDDRTSAESACVAALGDRSKEVQSAAALAVGHLARRFRTVGAETINAVSARANDPWMSARVEDAMDDIAGFASDPGGSESGLFECPVCGFAALSDAPWRGESSSDEICPACGVQFGLDDAGPGSAEWRTGRYAVLRQRWKDNGYPWFSSSTLPPEGWDPAGLFGQTES